MTGSRDGSVAQSSFILHKSLIPLLAIISSATTLLAAPADDFYDGAFRRGVAAFETGNPAAAASQVNGGREACDPAPDDDDVFCRHAVTAMLPQ